MPTTQCRHAPVSIFTLKNILKEVTKTRPYPFSTPASRLSHTWRPLEQWVGLCPHSGDQRARDRAQRPWGPLWLFLGME